MAATAEENFAGRLVDRLGPHSCLIDAANGRTISPEDLPKLIAAYGVSLLSAGLRPGDRLLIGCTLSPSSALVYWEPSMQASWPCSWKIARRKPRRDRC